MPFAVDDPPVVEQVDLLASLLHLLHDDLV
jgi:hypothetical protein